jgi:subtilisin family serine protease
MRSLKPCPASSRLTASILAVVLPCALGAAAGPAPDLSATAAAGPFSAQPRTAETSLRIEPELEAAVRLHGETTVLIDFGARPDLSPALSMDWDARGRFVVARLQAAAERSQARTRAYLDAKGLPYEAFWIDNLIVVRSVSRGVLDDLLSFEEIRILRADRTMMVIEPVARSEASSGGRLVEPNIAHVHADQAWGQGITGNGMVVAGIDTGVRYTHEVLLPHYRGNLGGGVYNHDYNWLDGVDGSASAPADDHGHGSHTMGTMIGDDGGANQVGMAPGAKWIACDGCEGSGCSASGLLTCAQWVAAPYPIGSPSSPDPSKRPHVVNNSWGDCGQSYDSWYQGVVDSWHAAGVYPVFANVNASNCGYSYPPGCNTVGNPGRYGNVTGVGSTGQSDGTYAAHSNWGPTDDADTVNPNGFPTVKPQVVAPGVDIRSALNSSNSSYGSWGGTSMSAPHVAGLIALMWQGAPCLIGNYAETENIIQASATAIPYPSNCGGEGPGNIPNMATGWGEIDAYEAVTQAAAFCGGSWVVFIDGFEDGTTGMWSNVVP